MIFSEMYEKAIFNAITKSSWNVYNGKYPKMIAPGTLLKYRIEEPKFERNNRYILLPSRDFFINSNKLKPEVLDQKVLNMFNTEKPLVRFFLDKEVLTGFTLQESDVLVDLVYHKKYKLDPKPVKEHRDSVSYRYFVDVLGTLERPALDKFV